MKLYGVFVGVDKYADERIQPLQFAKADAQHFYNTVRQALDSEESDLRLLTDENAIKSAVVNVIGEELSRVVNEDDIVLLYFACHGSPELAGGIDTISRYLILHDTEYERIFSTGVELETELQRVCFDRLRAQLIVVFIDACFSGRAGGRTFEGPQILRRRYKSGTRGTIQLKNLQVGEGRIIITASDDTEVSREYAALQHGVFTHYLVNVLSSTKTDDDVISLSLLYDEVSRHVYEYTNGRQNPILNGRTKLGRLPLFRPSKTLGS